VNTSSLFYILKQFFKEASIESFFHFLFFIFYFYFYFFLSFGKYKDFSHHLRIGSNYQQKELPLSGWPFLPFIQKLSGSKLE